MGLEVDAATQSGSQAGKPGLRWLAETRELRTMADLLPVLAQRTVGELVFPELNTSLAHREIPARAYGVAAELRRAGMDDRPDRRVGILAATSPEFVSALFGVFAANVAAVPIPVPSFAAGLEPALERLDGLVRSAELRCVLVGPPFDEFGAAIQERYPDVAVVRIADCEPLPELPQARMPKPQDLAVVQFSSGSTSSPKGAMIEHGALVASVLGTAERGGVEDGDAAMVWVPLFHDFGLVTLLTHLVTASDLHMFSPVTFVRRTAETIRYFADQGIAFFTGPNFAYDRILDAAAAGRLDGIDLTGWKAAINAGEPVASTTLRRFDELLGPLGARPTVMTPGYGAAEFCVGISLQPAGGVAKTVHVDRGSLQDGGRVVIHDGPQPGAVPVVSQGPAFPGVEFRITDGGGRVVDEGHFGEIEARGPNMLRGYLDDHAATDAAIRDGWFRTQDTGFVLGGELYVSGRRSDMVVVAGRNFHAHDVEMAIRDVDGVYQRHVVVVADVSRERMVVVAETQTDDQAALVAGIRARIADEVGLADVDVRLVARGWLPRTSSGKWRRGEVRERLFAGCEV
ncbi:AMP-binding protein [Lentzea jiangxiensis]|uniref:Acyl-CoA synthetase (AMP-forming)/AMP-acid ligase II n=1 Tax=Lentzea jiangxiensis TaxID=641025 RepID=A0A1H0WZ43_9PSEU|nr:AMP-binding protein [Lentzea jiangxiensis]SDP95859.1 Acyl-CoA synthetase (AMP-forming)/AMP-acid ligase II [Lentzea jiangxiensis]